MTDPSITEALTTVDTLMKALRDEFKRRKLSKRQLADLAGLHPNTLADFHRSDWRPSICTIRALEIALLPSGLTSTGPDKPSEPAAVAQEDHQDAASVSPAVRGETPAL